MERKLFIIMLLSLMTMGAIDSKAQDFRHKHEPREQRMFCLSDEKFTIFSFGDKKLAALRLMAPCIIDPHRAYLIYDKLTFQSEKDEADRIIGGCGKHR